MLGIVDGLDVLARQLVPAASDRLKTSAGIIMGVSTSLSSGRSS
jgi:hypothetical protein